MVGINELDSYFEYDDSLLLYRKAGEYIIDNMSYSNKESQSIKLYVNESAHVDSVKYVSPYE